jgi:hypothetical protein
MTNNRIFISAVIFGGHAYDETPVMQLSMHEMQLSMHEMRLSMHEKGLLVLTLVTALMLADSLYPTKES